LRRPGSQSMVVMGYAGRSVSIRCGRSAFRRVDSLCRSSSSSHPLAEQLLDHADVAQQTAVARASPEAPSGSEDVSNRATVGRRRAALRVKSESEIALREAAASARVSSARGQVSLTPGNFEILMGRRVRKLPRDNECSVQVTATSFDTVWLRCSQTQGPGPRTPDLTSFVANASQETGIGPSAPRTTVSRRPSVNGLWSSTASDASSP
jgi:hypothetical protein